MQKAHLFLSVTLKMQKANFFLTYCKNAQFSFMLTHECITKENVENIFKCDNKCFILNELKKLFELLSKVTKT